MAKELVWIDLEMTGLNPQIHKVIEIATIITDSELNIIAKGPDLVINASDDELNKMNAYVRDMHTKSGLIDEVRKSTLTIRDAEIETLEFINKHIRAKNKPPVCGNSIGTDRRFLDAQMNDLENRFHYRVVDVSSIKELANRWYPNIDRNIPSKAENHRALEDIIESIEELKYYRKKLFI
tara:strand:- start:130 stop:669 length:540 start_codon:yes stop_codon:yes gene_type:complete